MLVADNLFSFIVMVAVMLMSFSHVVEYVESHAIPRYQIAKTNQMSTRNMSDDVPPVTHGGHRVH